MALGVCAWLVADASQLLANLFAFAAIVALLYPLASRFRRGPAPPRAQMWRGREIDISPPRADPLGKLDDWWRRRK